MDPAALQIEKEQVKTVQFNPDDDVIPFTVQESLSGSGSAEEGNAEGTDDGAGSSQGEIGGATSSLQTGVENKVEERSLAGGAEGTCAGSFTSKSYLVRFFH
jgi:hypothetical protein